MDFTWFLAKKKKDSHGSSLFAQEVSLIDYSSQWLKSIVGATNIKLMKEEHICTLLPADYTHKNLETLIDALYI